MITVHLIKRKRLTTEWMLDNGTQCILTHTNNVYKRNTIQTIRYLINRTFKLNNTDYMFLGNRRINGIWITEWMTL